MICFFIQTLPNTTYVTNIRRHRISRGPQLQDGRCHSPYCCWRRRCTSQPTRCLTTQTSQQCSSGSWQLQTSLRCMAYSCRSLASYKMTQQHTAAADYARSALHDQRTVDVSGLPCCLNGSGDACIQAFGVFFCRRYGTSGHSQMGCSELVLGVISRLQED